MDHDPYETLGVPKDASADDIKQAYRKLAFQHHPDRNQDNLQEAEKRFKDITDAYAVLGDPEKRSRYDSGGNDDQAASMFDFMASFMREQHVGRRSPAEINGTVELSLLDVLRGRTVEVACKINRTCGTCHGKAVDTSQANSKVRCGSCDGKGWASVRMPFGTARMQCQRCGGAGKSYPPCSACAGRGVFEETKNISVEVPPGIRHGTHIGLDVEGGVVVMALVKTPEGIRYDVSGNVYQTLNLTYPQTQLGATLPVDMIDGSSIKAKIPAGVEPGQGIRLRGKGIPKSIKSPVLGDYILMVSVKWPDVISDRQRDLLTKLQEVYDSEGV